MTQQPIEIEGTWEEIMAHSAQLAGCSVYVTVLSHPPQTPSSEKPSSFRPASGHSLLRHAGTWAGNDLEECLESVYKTRSPLEF
ncbi:hypothetical protein [Roseofilum sp. Guam]|uniref:hypothetical protein n=1 Tax=Roseofilum sp. Guam TaxID=2821502 RepID=UPI001B18421A|nr:hypothetical protein [Roseofilum sp. Guam]MBP0030836.1 hypothetical protein [Roseofilum sp. Guam]